MCACEGFSGRFVGVMHEDDHFPDIGGEFRELIDGGVDGMRIGRGEIDLVEDGCDILVEERFDACFRERAVGRESGGVAEDDAERRLLGGVCDGEYVAREAVDVERLVWADDMEIGVVVKRRDFGLAVLVDERFHGRAEAVFPEVGAFDLRMFLGESVGQPEADFAVAREERAEEDFLEPERVVAVQMCDERAVDVLNADVLSVKRERAEQAAVEQPGVAVRADDRVRIVIDWGLGPGVSGAKKLKRELCH